MKNLRNIISKLSEYPLNPIQIIKEWISLKKSDNFDPKYYIENHPDIAKYKHMPYLHFILSGKHEARQASENYVNDFSQFEKYRYQCSIKCNQAMRQIKTFKKSPLISLLIYFQSGLNLEDLKDTIHSISQQYYTNIEILMALKDAPEEKANIELMIKSAGNPEILVAGDLADAHKKCSGVYVALVRAGDMLTKDAIFTLVKQMNQDDADLFYSDDDKIKNRHAYYDPYFKSDFSYDTFISHNFIGCFAAVKTSLLQSINMPFEQEMGDAICYNLYLKVIEKSRKIHHIQKVLYHKRIFGEVIAAKRSIQQCVGSGYQKAIKNHLKRINRSASVTPGLISGSYKVTYAITGTPLVSIIIPFKDKIDILEVCVRSIIAQTDYSNFEIICVDNNSTKDETQTRLKQLTETDHRIKAYQYNIPFNYSRINNHAVNAYASGEYILFLNNDTEVLTRGWLYQMLHFAQRDDVGAVGAKMYYPNNTIQTAGVGLGIRGFFGEYHKFFDRYSDGYFGRLKMDQNVRAVSAACMMVEKEKFIAVGGFDEKNFAVNYNDLDLCFKLLKKGYHNIFTPFAELYHYESLSRTRKPTQIETQEKRAFKTIYYNWIKDGDPYYNPNLDQRTDRFSLLKG